MREIHQWPVSSPYKWPITRKMFPFDCVIMQMKSTQRKDDYHQICSLLFSISNQKVMVSQSWDSSGNNAIPAYETQCCTWRFINKLHKYLTHWSRDKLAAIFQTTFSNAFFKWICMIKISLMFVPKDPNDNVPALVQIMAWRRPGDKLLSEPKLVTLLTLTCVMTASMSLYTIQCNVMFHR